MMTARVRRAPWAAVLAMCCATFMRHGAARADEAEDAPYTLFSNNVWGSRGGWHLHAARALRSGTLALSINDTLTAGSSVLSRGDHDFQASLGLSLIWAACEGLELGLSQVSLIDRYDQVLPEGIQVQGNPTLLVKYTPPFNDWFGIGGVLQLTVPTSPGGKGLDPSSLSFQLVGTGSLRVHDAVELSANLGYVFDRSAHLFDGHVQTPIEHYVYGVDDSQHRGLYGLSAVALFDVQETVGISPFVEWFGQFVGDVPAPQNPMSLSVGGKVFPSRTRWVEGVVGVDVRLAGEPHVQAAPAGIPAWRVFTGLTLRLGESLPSRDRVWVPRCDVNKPCEAGHACEGYACVQVHEVVVEKIVKQEVVKAPEMVAFTGVVLDAQSKRPLAGAKVAISGQQDAITVDSETGQFNVCPLPADGGVVQLTAHALGYTDGERTATRTAAAAEQPLTFALRPMGSAATGVVRGTVSDALTGKPLANVSITVPSTDKHIAVEADGTFEGSLKVGHYQVFVAAPGYVTQKKELRVQSDATIVLNIDLQPVQKSPAKRRRK